VLRHPACRKDAFVWSNFSSEDEDKRNECACWRASDSVEEEEEMTVTVQCYWETWAPEAHNYWENPFKFYYQLQTLQELPEAGRDECWVECAPYSRTSGRDVAHQDVGGCATCINVLDLHLLDPSLAHLEPGGRVAQVGPALARGRGITTLARSCLRCVRLVLRAALLRLTAPLLASGQVSTKVTRNCSLPLS